MAWLPPRHPLRPETGAPTENAGWGLEQDAARPGCYSAGTRTLEAATRGELKGTAAGDVALIPGAGRTTPWVWHWAWNADWGAGERRSSPRVYIAGTRNLGTAMRGERRGTQCGQWLRREPPRRRNCAATVSVRSGVAVRPEHVEAADRLLLLRSHSAGHCEAAGGREPFQAQGEECEASWPLRCGKGVQGYLAGSSRYLLNRGSAGTGLRRGMGSGIPSGVWLPPPQR